ncbi:MAG TPA: ABC transporter ATP-binding protein [Thermoanaerobaculia bacterium]|nr:ABC transporter ATP-binding protein [Thermoanaerobaculia bacterium]HUM30094.1 ABC transporter ATP-binding protein [Thermoanaerobaculia bacterium]HXK68791.1 ABC transporter ATP-binding protein [Thermoanaerobaculia bacterium]
MTEPVITVEGAVFDYPGKRALNGIDLVLNRGTVTGLLGPNGAGKSTLVKLLNGLIPACAGTIRILGLDPWKDRAQLQKRMGFAPESSYLYPWMKVKDHLAFYARNYPGWDLPYVKERLDTFKVPLGTAVERLSKGQRGMVSLLTALGRRSEILLLDDPTLGLDIPSRKYLYSSIVEDLAEREVTILFATHLPSEVEGILTHAAIMDNGRILKSGFVEDLKGLSTSSGSETRALALEDLVLLTLEEARHDS